MTENLDPETGFLEQLGQRVRTMRALRGMSRKVLALSLIHISEPTRPY